MNMEAAMAIESGFAGATPAAKRRRSRFGENSIIRAISSAPVTVRTKLLVGFVAIAALLVLVGVLGLVALGRSSARVERLGTLQANAAAYKGLETDVVQIKNLLLERATFTPRAGVPLGHEAKVPPSESYLVLDSTINQALTTFIGDATVLEKSEPALFGRVYGIYRRLSALAQTMIADDVSGKGALAGSIVREERELAERLALAMNGLAT